MDDLKMDDLILLLRFVITSIHTIILLPFLIRDPSSIRIQWNENRRYHVYCVQRSVERVWAESVETWYINRRIGFEFSNAFETLLEPFLFQLYRVVSIPVVEGERNVDWNGIERATIDRGHLVGKSTFAASITKRLPSLAPWTGFF